MISLKKTGEYKLFESKGQTKILVLDDRKTFAWVNAENIGEILVTAKKEHPIDCILATGEYRIYAIKAEPTLSDQLHLELAVGSGLWQGYLLPTGLPDQRKKRNRIIPTGEVISEES